MTVTLFRLERFTSAAGLDLDWKIECDALTAADWACIAKVCSEAIGPFGAVFGVPQGGVPFAQALSAHRDPTSPRVLVADDVWTTGKSMREFARKTFGDQKWYGVVAFARAPLSANVVAFMQVSIMPLD